MTLVVVCPKCRREEEIKLNRFLLREMYVAGSANLAYYHVDHILYVNIDRYGIKTMAIYDPPSMLVHGLNVYVDGYFVLRQPIIPNRTEIMFVDLKRKIADARLISNHIHAITFVRYIKLNGRKIPEEGDLNVYGIRYIVRKNGEVILARKVGDGKSESENEILNRLMLNIKEIPANLHKILNIIGNCK